MDVCSKHPISTFLVHLDDSLLNFMLYMIYEIALFDFAVVAKQ